MDSPRPGTKIAEDMLGRPEGATMDDIRSVTGGPQYNVLANLEGRGFTIRKVKEGRRTRYFASPPDSRSYEAKVTSQGQITIPKEIREHLQVRKGGKLRIVVENGHVTLAPSDRSIRDLFGILGKPPRGATFEDMDQGVRRAVVEKYRKTVGGKRR